MAKKKQRKKPKADPFAQSNYREPWEPKAIHPILFLKMEPGDEGWDEGYRWRVDQPDDDQHFFRDRERAEDFVIQHGLQVVSLDDMKKLWDKRPKR